MHLHSILFSFSCRSWSVAVDNCLDSIDRNIYIYSYIGTNIKYSIQLFKFETYLCHYSFLSFFFLLLHGKSSWWRWWCDEERKGKRQNRNHNKKTARLCVVQIKYPVFISFSFLHMMKHSLSVCQSRSGKRETFIL